MRYSISVNKETIYMGHPIKVKITYDTDPNMLGGPYCFIDISDPKPSKEDTP